MLVSPLLASYMCADWLFPALLRLCLKWGRLQSISSHSSPSTPRSICATTSFTLRCACSRLSFSCSLFLSPSLPPSLTLSLARSLFLSPSLSPPLARSLARYLCVCICTRTCVFVWIYIYMFNAFKSAKLKARSRARCAPKHWMSDSIWGGFG